MTIACGGKCGRAGCPWTGESMLSLQGHIGGVRARTQGKGWFSKTPSSGSVKGRPVAMPGGPEARPFYAPLKDLPAGFGAPSEEKTGAAAPGRPSAPPPGPLFDSTPWWLSLGELLDTTVLAEKKVKVRMDEAKAKRLDASLQAAGWTVTANPNPVSLPFWAPIVITVIGTFALPLLIAYVPDLIKKARAQAEEARKRMVPARSPAPPAATITRKPGGEIHVEPPPEPEPEEEEPRMRAAPPPFSWRPMPWHEPGST